MDIQPLVQFLQLFIRKEFAGWVFLSSLFILLLPENFAEFLRLAAYRNEYGHFIGSAFVCSLCVLGVHGIRSGCHLAQQKFHAWEQKRAQERELTLQRVAVEEQQRILGSLSKEQEAIISRFTEQRTRHCILPAYTPELHELEKAGILIPNSKVFLSEGWKQAFTLSDAASDYLYHKAEGS